MQQKLTGGWPRGWKLSECHRNGQLGQGYDREMLGFPPKPKYSGTCIKVYCWEALKLYTFKQVYC